MNVIKWLRPVNYRRPRYTPVMRGYRYSMDNKPSSTVYKAFFKHAFRRNYEFDTMWNAMLKEQGL